MILFMYELQEWIIGELICNAAFLEKKKSDVTVNIFFWYLSLLYVPCSHFFSFTLQSSKLFVTIPAFHMWEAEANGCIYQTDLIFRLSHFALQTQILIVWNPHVTSQILLWKI